MSRPLRGAALLACGCALHLDAAAQQFALGAIRQDYRSIERYPSGAVSNEERGTLNGARIEGSVPTGPLSLALDVMQARGTVNYDGRTQLGLPLQTSTDLQHRAASLLVLGRLSDYLELGGGIGTREIDRRIRPTAPSALHPSGTQGLNERLRATEWRLAARAFWPTAFGSRFSIEGDWLRSVDGRLRADFLGTFDTAQLSLPDWSAWSAKLAWSHRVGAWQFRIHHEWLHFEVPAAGPQPLTAGGGDAGASFSYPGSDQRIRAIALQVGYAF
jgi:hypothetical protein